MPNKKKFAKLKLNALRKGKLNDTQEIVSTMKFIKEKQAKNNEDINFDFDEKRAGFAKLADEDSCDKQIRKSMLAEAKKRKSKLELEKAAKKQKKEAPGVEKKPESTKPSIVPKNSKKNKYFFMAHPEKLKKHSDEIENISNSTNFVIDEEKLKMNKILKKNKTIMKNNGTLDKNESTKTNDKKTKKSNNIWMVEECSSDDETELENTPKINKNTKLDAQILDFDDLDKKIKFKKVRKRQPDGTMVEMYEQEFITKDEYEDNEVDNESDDLEAPETAVKEKKEEDPKEFTNPLREKLKSAQFRYLNELLYKQPSQESYKYFEKEKEAFTAYHEGFRNQIAKWPSNPIDEIIKYVSAKSGKLIIADFGCGEAKLAQSVPNKVHSFDLVAINDLVTKCDMRKVPLNNESVDVAVFCLSLMGTNVIDFLCEAHRVMKNKGVLKIAEVTSRIEDRYIFIRKVESIGFKLVTNKEEETAAKKAEYFYFFDFVKNSPTVKGKPDIKLIPCVYKKR